MDFDQNLKTGNDKVLMLDYHAFACSDLLKKGIFQNLAEANEDPVEPNQKKPKKNDKVFKNIYKSKSVDLSLLKVRRTNDLRKLHGGIGLSRMNKNFKRINILQIYEINNYNNNNNNNSNNNSGARDRDFSDLMGINKPKFNPPLSSHA